METQAIITQFITDEFMRGEGEAPLEPNRSLVSTGILDSLALLKLLMFIEERFNLKVADGEVIPSNFETVNRITEFVETKQRTALL